METGVSSEYDPPPYPPGLRFTPSDVVLIEEYLLVKINGGKLPCDVIKEENVYAYNPEDLTEKYREDFEDNWYFFTPRNRKYAGGSRPSRSAKDGYWRATGSDKDIINKDGKKIGVKKSLAFYSGEQPRGTKTNWLMDEYRIAEYQQPIHPETKSMLLDSSVLCRIHYGRSGSRGATSSCNATNKNEVDNMIEDSLLMSAEADQPDKTTDNAPALAEVVAVEPVNNIRQDQFNPLPFAMNSDAEQADVTTDNPLALPEGIVSESTNNIFQDQFNPSTLANFDDGPWEFFHSQVAPSLDISNDVYFQTNAPALVEEAVEPTNSIRRDQFNPLTFAMNSDAEQADVTTDNPLALPEGIASESTNNIFQDQFNPSTLANFDDGPWEFFHSQVAPSLDILNDVNFPDQVCGDSVDQYLPSNFEHLDFDCLWTYWNGEVDDDAKLQESSLDEANTQVQQSRLGDSTMKT